MDTQQTTDESQVEADEATAETTAEEATTGEASSEENGEQANASENESEGPKVATKEPEFAELNEGPPVNQIGSMNRFLDVSVQVAAELGKVTIPIGDLLKIGEGSVIELNRAVSDPIDLVAQGVKIASGEVVVIDDCFAIRIKEVESESSG